MIDFSLYKNIWVFIETDGQNVYPVSLELLTKARILAQELKEEVCAVVIGQGNKKFYEELSRYGAVKIYSVEGSSYQTYTTLPYANTVAQLIAKYKPSAVLYPSTYLGRDLAPRVAAQMYLGLTADCTDLSIKDGVLVQTRPAFGGNILADIYCPKTRPQMATVRANIFEKKPLEVFSVAQIIEESILVSEDLLKVKVISSSKDKPTQDFKLTTASIVLSGGRGLKTKENFDLLKETSSMLGAAVGATRAVIDEGFIDKEHQVGQSGVTVKPAIYIAFGISGALQHTSGMDKTPLVIAVNKNPHAQIFNFSKYNFVCDAPQTLKKLKELLKNSSTK